MPRKVTLDIAPPLARWMKDSLDRSVFYRSIPVLAVRVPPAKAGLVMKAEAMRGSIMNLPKVRSVVADPANPDENRLVLLRIQNEVDLSTDAKEFLQAQSADLTTYQLELNYDYWTADEILQAILPEDLLEDSPTGFAVTGHLAHINLNAEYLPYKHIIGQVVMDKNKKIRTVVNKLDSIDTKFRFFKMELIAGEPDFVVEHHESDCRFTFDFTQVYWNSRLHTEHDRLVQLFQPSDVVADVFAGVGPFAIPAGKKGCGVLANDLNPNSYKYLQKNIADNKVQQHVRAFCEDGRDFIRVAAKRALENPLPSYEGPRATRSKVKEQRRARVKQTAGHSAATSSRPADAAPQRSRVGHFVMNLPDSAISFVDAFRGILAGESEAEESVFREVYETMPMVHCHCFTRELETDAARKDIQQRVEEQLGHPLGKDVSLHFVRSVAPSKDMYCISFRLPQEAAFARR